MVQCGSTLLVIGFPSPPFISVITSIHGVVTLLAFVIGLLGDVGLVVTRIAGCHQVVFWELLLLIAFYVGCNGSTC